MPSVCPRTRRASRSNAPVPDATGCCDATVRDRHIAQIRSNGCMAWQTATGYNQRSRIETQMGRWKSVIGPKLKFRSFSRQITEVQLGRKVLNTMTALGRPVFERIS